MRDQTIKLTDGLLVIGVEQGGRGAWLELHAAAGDGSTKLEEGQLLMAIEALSMAYGVLCGARPDTLARAVNRTLRNRAHAARARSGGTQAGGTR